MKKINKFVHFIINLLPCIYLAFVMLTNSIPIYFSNGDSITTISNKSEISSSVTSSFGKEISNYTFVSIDNSNSINSYKDFYFTSVENFYSTYYLNNSNSIVGYSQSLYSLTYQLNINYFDYLNFSRFGIFSLNLINGCDNEGDTYSSFVYSFDFGIFGNFIDKYILRNFYDYSSSDVLLSNVYSRDILDSSINENVFKTLFYSKHCLFAYFLWLLNYLFIFNILYYIYFIVISLFTFIFKVLEN